MADQRTPDEFTSSNKNLPARAAEPLRSGTKLSLTFGDQENELNSFKFIQGAQADPTVLSARGAFSTPVVPSGAISRTSQKTKQEV